MKYTVYALLCYICWWGNRPREGRGLTPRLPRPSGTERGGTVLGREKSRERIFFEYFRPSMGIMSFAVILKRTPQIRYYYGHFTDEGPSLGNIFTEAESGLG